MNNLMKNVTYSFFLKAFFENSVVAFQTSDTNSLNFLDDELSLLYPFTFRQVDSSWI